MKIFAVRNCPSEGIEFLLFYRRGAMLLSLMPSFKLPEDKVRLEGGIVTVGFDRGRSRDGRFSCFWSRY